MYDPIEINSLKTIHDYVLVSDMHFSERVTSSGILLRSDDGKSEGIRPRWGKVYAVGPKQKDVAVGQWVLVAHGRWTRGVDIIDAEGVKYSVRRIDVNDLLCVSDEPIDDDFVNNGI
jgi:co-chaperonin GroES (HSP10)